MKHTCHSHIKRHSKSHSKPVMEGEKKRRLASCLQRLFTTRNENSRRKRKEYSVQPNVNIVAHSGLTEEAFSGHCYDRFQIGLSSQLFLFFYTLTCFYMLQASDMHSLVLLSNIQEVAHFTAGRGEKKKRNASCCTKVCLFIQINLLDASTDTLTSSKALS